MQNQDEPDLLGDLLRQVSRSFYLTLRVLPSSIGPQIGLAYLLARIADTIADTEILPLEDRLSTLRKFRDQAASSKVGNLQLDTFTDAQSDGAEKTLLQRAGEALEILRNTEIRDATLVREVLSTIISGQELDLIRFSAASIPEILALKTAEELDDYTYRVAGCVGQFWTHICLNHMLPRFHGNIETLLADGVRFGKGLQLVNILRDLPRDLAAGRCYLPSDDLKQIGLAPSDLLDLRSASKLRGLFRHWHNTASDHLAAGWRYTNTLPRSWVRVRLACAWPVLIGQQTLDLLAGIPNLDPSRRPKIAKSKVRSILLKTLVWYPFPQRWSGLFVKT